MFDILKNLPVEFILQNLPADAPQALTAFIAEKQKELQGKLYVQLSYKVYLKAGKYQKGVVLTIFCRQADKTFPLPEFNNKPLKELIQEYKKQLGFFTTLLVRIDIPNLVNKAFEQLEKQHQGNVKIFIYNNETDTETIFEIKYPNKEPDKHDFEGLLALLLTQKDTFNDTAN